MGGTTAAPFSYADAFSRNLGWVTEQEQARLRQARVAVAGLGGVGGFHVTTLARLGVGKFSVADFDTFDIVNFNRQAGATVSSLGRPKAMVIPEMGRDINPEADIRTFAEGVTPENIDAFLDGVSVYIDGLDFFAFEARERVFAACRSKGIPAVTAAPLGMGAAVLVFTADSMSFEDYFGFAGRSDTEKALRFLIGLAPRGLHRSYLVDPARIDLVARKGPSTAMGCMMCASVAATETLKLVLQRGDIKAAPWGYHVDGYTQRLVRTWRPGGHRNPLQRALITMGLKALRGPAAA